MRIVAGTHGGRRLTAPKGRDVRPTSDRVREALFSILGAEIEDARVLDLFAGSGALGIEALSRGASFVTFVERVHKFCGLIEANLDLVGVPEEMTEVVKSDAAEYLKRTANGGGQDWRGGAEAWDIVYFDPPYASDYAPVLRAFGQHTSALVREGGLIIVEHHHKNAPPDSLGPIRRWRVLKQGDSALSFYEAG